MALLSRNFTKTENEAKTLVKLLTGFSDEDVNFKLCMDFVVSNFKYHKFTDVDSHKITRNIEGICQKFDVHCEYKKKETLKRLTDVFLDQEISEEYFYPKSDVHYGLLLILLNTSENPLHTEFIPKEKSQLVPEAQDDFDWPAYLLEGAEFEFGPFPDTPDITDDETEDESESDRENSDEKKTEITNRFSGDATGASLALIAQSVVVPYWLKEVDGVLFDDRYSAGMVDSDWQEHRSRQNILNQNPDRDVAVLTENQLIREIVWMLNGVTKLFAFSFVNAGDDGGHFELNPDTHVSHVVSDTLHLYLRRVAGTASLLRRLLEFVRTKPSKDCQTYEAFRDAISEEFVAIFFAKLNDFEKIVIHQEESMTLLKFFDSFAEEFRLIDHLYHSYHDGVLSSADVTRPSANVTRSSTLLTTLYNMAVELDQTENRSSGEFKLILNVFVRTCEPYLNMVDLWLQQGVLLDPRCEFAVQKGSELSALEKGFWDKAYTVYCKQIMSSSNLESESVEQTQTTADLVVPCFFEPILNFIILAGKSAEMLHVMWKNVSGQSLDRALFKTFHQNMKEYFGEEAEITESDPVPSKVTENDGVSLKSENSDSVVDRLMKLNLHHQLKEDYLTSDPTRTLNYHIDVTKHHSTFDRSVEKCLNPVITELYTFTCGKLIEVLKVEYNLLEQFQRLRQFYLLEAGDVMYEFYSEIFDKIKNKERWKDVSFLNIQLRECCGMNRWPEGIGRFVVAIRPPPTTTTTQGQGSRPRNKAAVDILKDLELHFEVNWPVNIIISGEALDVYKQIFTLLLQVKYAKYSLDNLTFQQLMAPERDDDDNPPVSTRLSSGGTVKDAPKILLSKKAMVLRMRLMHFVNGVHTYIMTRILHSTGLEFESDVSQAKDLDNIVTAHNAYLGKLVERCLLHNKVSMIKEAMMKVLNLSIYFQTAWTQGIDCLRPETLDKMDREFQNCNRFILASLKVAVRRASLPHLDSLLMSLAPTDDV